MLLADGTTKPIEQVGLGDVVLATDPATGRSESRPVVATRVHDNEPQRTEVTVDVDGDAGSATATLTATDWHPVWAPDLRAWVPIGNLQAGSWLRTSTGTWVQATAVRHHTGTSRVHDLTIADIHSYHVLAGTTPILVHNCGDGVPDTGSAADADGPLPGEYGPFNRHESPSQMAEVAAEQVRSGEIWGRPVQRGVGQPVVQAYVGRLPEGQRGIEFYTRAEPRYGASPPNEVRWYPGQKGVETRQGGDFAAIFARITKNTQI